MAFRQGDQWTTSHDACEALAREVMENISQRNQQQKNSIASNKASALARQNMKKYEDQFNALSKSLISMRGQLTEREFERRQQLVDTLSSKKVQMDMAFNDREPTGTRHALLGGDLGPSSTNVWDMEEDEETKDLSVGEIRQHQQLQIEAQDKGLESLYNVVVRQKQMAQNIGDELDLHTEIIDDIIDHAGNTRERLLKETRHVALVDRKSGSCAYWVVILLLLVAIIIVSVV